MLQRVRNFIRNLLQKKRIEQDLGDELHSFLLLLIDQKVRSGMPAEEARRAAFLELGGMEQVKEQVRDVRTGATVEAIGRDLRYGLRVLAKNRGFFITATATLALGIGTATTLFCVAESQLWRPLPFPEPSRLMCLFEQNLKRNWQQAAASSADFADWRQNARSFDHLAAIRWPEERNFSAANHIQRPRVGAASAGFFETLGVRPQVGRTFQLPEEGSVQNHVALLSDSLSREVFGSPQAALGSRVKLDGDSYTVVGILPSAFRLEIMRTPDVFIPLEMTKDRENRDLVAIGRLRSGTSLSAAQAEMDAIAKRLAEEFPETNRNWSVRLEDLRLAFTKSYRTSLFLYLGFSLFVLFIACANIAGLQLVRSLGRQREFAVREALGAGRTVLIRQTLLESFWIAISGTILGVVLAIWGVRALRLFPLADMSPRTSEISLDIWVLAFAATAAIASAFLFGLVPVIARSEVDIEVALRDSQRSVSGSAGTQRRLNGLVGAQIVLAFISLFGAALFVSSYQTLQRVPLGFNPQNIWTLHIPLSRANYTDNQRRTVFFEQVLENAEQTSGVGGVVLSNGLPLQPGGFINFARADRPLPAHGEESYSLDRIITPGYFQLMNIPLLRGRNFTSRDSALAPRVAIVNQNLVRHIFGAEDPIGKELTILPGGDASVSSAKVQIIGVVASIKEVGLNEVDFDDIYLPWAQNLPHSAFVLMKADSGATVAPLLRRKLQKLDGDEFISPPRSMDSYITEALGGARNKLMLVAIFAGLAIVLALVGVYGAISFAVAQRTREFGVRIALGALPQQMLRLALRRTCSLAVSAIVCGLAIAFTAGELLKSALYLVPHQHDGVLYAVSIHDPLSFSCSAGFLLLLALLASLVPALRASHVDPSEALRHE